jgi:phospholipid-binding lipoprotein MlaA
VNDVLQGNMGRAWTTTQRFVVNTTVGAAGLFDVASDWDLPAHKADFGQTLGVWGVESGPSVQLPLSVPRICATLPARLSDSSAIPLATFPGRRAGGGRRHR